MQGIINVSIEICIEATNETAAREYAAIHGINMSRSRWYPHRGGHCGRIYSNNTELPPPQQFAANMRAAAAD
jgi:hypothetical protein